MEHQPLQLLEISREQEKVPLPGPIFQGSFGYLRGATRNDFFTVYLNDLWSYDVNSGNWTWEKGSNNTNLPGVYGTQGVASPANNPGRRARTARGRMTPLN